MKPYPLSCHRRHQSPGGGRRRVEFRRMQTVPADMGAAAAAGSALKKKAKGEVSSEQLFFKYIYIYQTNFF